jgi:hypothetical protein
MLNRLSAARTAEAAFSWLLDSLRVDDLALAMVKDAERSLDELTSKSSELTAPSVKYVTGNSNIRMLTNTDV